MIFAFTGCGDSPSKGKMFEVNTQNDSNSASNNTSNNSSNNSSTNTSNQTNTRPEVPEGCGDGVVVAGEVCDGNCPTTCDDGDACTTDGSSGSARLCNLVCVNDPVTSCTDDDGCCAPGCTSANDNDCTCEPTTCEAAGAACGSIPDGCGSTLECGGCTNGACENNTCVTREVGEAGDACASDAECPDFCADAPDFRGGYCTSSCDDDFDCASGTHCVGLIGYSDKVCMPNCQADNDCRADGYGCWDADSDGTDECAPQPQGSSPIGGACNGIADCNTEANRCMGPDSIFPNGYCTRECFFNGMCPFGSICLTNQNGGGICAIECQMDSECRDSEGYACIDVSNDTTGEDSGMCLTPQ